MKTAQQSEARLISACMNGGPAFVADIASSGVSADMFSDPKHARLWVGLIEAATEDKKTGPFFVARRVFGAGMTEVQMLEVSVIAKLEPTTLYAKDLAREIIGEYRRKRVLAALAKATDSAANTPNWDDAWDSISAALSDATKSASEGAQATDLDALCDAAIAEETSDKPEGKVGTGIGVVDTAFGLIAAGEVNVIAGRPGVGKTALALQMADAVVLAGGSVMMVSLEMTPVSLLRRLAKQRSGRAGVINHGCTPSDYAAAKKARVASVETIRQADGRLHIFEGQDCGTLSKIEARARLLNSGSKPLDCLLIDYIGLVSPEDAKISREQQVAQVSRRTKLLALELKISIILIAQLNREAERNERVPRLSDLRDSGSIEQDADRVWLLYPSPSAPMAPDSPSAAVRLEQAKCRNGAAGQAIDVTFHKPSFSFSK